MRTWIVIALVVVAGISGAAEVRKTPKQVAAEKRLEAYLKAEAAKVAERRAMYNAAPEWREINGEIHRVPFFRDMTNTHWWNVSGRVVGVTADGLLVEGSAGRPFPGSGQGLFLLKNYPEQGSLVDGSGVMSLAMRTGTYNYTTVLGARKTVGLYDCGVVSAPPPPTPAELAAAEVARQARAAAAEEAERKAAAEKIRVAAAIRESHRKRAMEGSEASRKWLQERGEKVP